MPGLNFQAQFALPIVRLIKRSAICTQRKRNFMQGDRLLLWTGSPKQWRALGEAHARFVRPIRIYLSKVELMGVKGSQLWPFERGHHGDWFTLSDRDIATLVQMEGFDTPEMFFAYFRKQQLQQAVLVLSLVWIYWGELFWRAEGPKAWRATE
jgi:hypothetical protein